MKMRDIYHMVIKVLRKQAKDCPGKGFTNSSGKRVTIEELANSLEDVVQWMYHDLNTKDITKVVRCENCINYKKFRKKNAYKANEFYACRLDMKRRDPMYYCKDGEER